MPLHTVNPLFTSSHLCTELMICLAYLVELFPYAERARGIAVEQFFGRGAGFFSTYVNPIALKAITWKYLAIYCGWITVEVLFVFFFYPETYGRTLEELAFCKSCLLFLTLLRSPGYRTGSDPKSPHTCMADFYLQCSKTSHWQTMSWSLSRSRSIMGTRNTETWWNLRMLRRLRRRLLSDHKLAGFRRTLISPFEPVVDSQDRVLSLFVYSLQSFKNQIKFLFPDQTFSTVCFRNSILAIGPQFSHSLAPYPHHLKKRTSTVVILSL
jgi:hypothetical protein